MPDIVLAAEPRATLGTAPSRRFRSKGRIPAVIYGHGLDPESVTIDARELRAALATMAAGNVLFNLSVGSQRHLAIAREVQRHPVRRTVSHVDFQVVRRDEVVPAEVPVHILGEALGVTRQGGTVEHSLLSLHVHAKPADIPAAIEVDISALEIGDVIRVGDLAIGEGVLVDLDAETPVVIAQAPHAVAAEGELAEETTAESTESGAGEAAGGSDESGDEH